MALKFQPFKPKAEPLMMLVCGQQGDGKTTAMASLLRAETMLLYVSAFESHSPTYMSHGCSLYPAMMSYKDEPIPAANPDNLFAVAVDVCEETDVQLLPWAEKVPVGTKLNADQSNAKLCAYIDAAHSIGVKSVVIDSLTALMAVFKATSTWKTMCTTKDGKHDGWSEGKAYLHLIQDMFKHMIELKAKGINCVLTCGAKKEFATGNNGEIEASAFTPELPSYGVIQFVVYFFPDIAPISRSSEYPGYARVFDFEVDVKKASVDGNTKVVKKFMNMTPRLLCAGNIPLTTLPADLWRIPEFVQGTKESLNG
jgi:hypothetical protein